MGLWAGLNDLVRKGVDEAKKLGATIKSGVTNMWNKFSGRDDFEEANNLYEEIAERYNTKREEFESDTDRLVESIERHVGAINQYKKKITNVLFPEFAEKITKIKDVKLPSGFSVEEYIDNPLNLDGIRDRSEMFSIDFNKHKLKTTIQAVFTLGFYTRKKAKETLLRVHEEEKKLEDEMSRMDAAVTQLEMIETSLDNVEHYFASLIEIYEQMLVRLDNSVSYLCVKCLTFAHKIVKIGMSMNSLPMAQRKEIEAIVSASKILKVMTEIQLLSIEDDSNVRMYCSNIEKQYTELNRVYKAA